MMKRIFKSVAIWIVVGEALIAFVLWCMGFRITYAPELDNNWDAISAVAEWAGVVVGAIIVPLVVVCLQHKWESNKEEIALSNLVTIDQLREFEQKIAPLLKEQESDKAPLTIKPELSMREQQLLQFLSVSMGASRNEISEQLGLSGASTQHLIKRLLEEEKIEASQEEVDEKIKEMATSYGRKEEELSKNEALVEYLRNSVKTEKAIELIVKNAKIKK